jgi:hypothetical protein
MSTLELKAQFHQLIDQIDDDIFLQNTLSIFQLHKFNKGQKLILSSKQQNDLEIALDQVKQGKVVAHNIVRAKLQKKIDLCLLK